MCAMPVLKKPVVQCSMDGSIDIDISMDRKACEKAEFERVPMRL